MSEDVKVEKKVRCIVEGVRYDSMTQTIDFTATLSGKIKSEDKWSIEDASTKVLGVKVPVRDMIVRVMIGWFWVRKVQDILRKGTISDARSALNVGYDWNEATSRKATDAAPAIVGARVIAKMDSADDLKRLIAAAEAKIAELAAKESATPNE